MSQYGMCFAVVTWEVYVALEVVGRSGGLVVAWNKSLFAKVNQRVGWHVVAVQLARLANG